MFALADHFRVPISTIAEWSDEEIAGWLAYFEHRGLRI